LARCIAYIEFLRRLGDRRRELAGFNLKRKAIAGWYICQECNIFYRHISNSYDVCRRRLAIAVIRIRIDELLKQHRRSFYWLAKETGISHTTLWRLKKDKAQGITFNTLERICKVLKCQPGDVLTLGRARPGKKA